MNPWDGFFREVGAACRLAMHVGVSALPASGALIVAALFVGFLLRRRNPELRSLIYRAAVCGVLLQPVLCFAALGRAHPLVSVGLSEWKPAQPAMLVAAQRPAAGRPARSSVNRPVSGRSVSANVTSDAASLEVRQAGGLPNAEIRRRDVASSRSDVFVAVSATWLLGTSALLAWMAVGQLSLLRLKQSSRPCDNVEALGALDLVRRSLRCRPVEARVSARVRSPILAGMRKPVLFLPDDWREVFVPQTLRAVFAHEMTHVRRRDCFWMLLARCACALFWMNPLAWALLYRLESTSEEICDHAALREECTPRSYAECLHRLAVRANRMPALGATGAEAAGFRSSLGRRIERILAPLPHEGKPLMNSTRLYTATSALCLAVICPFVVAASPGPMRNSVGVLPQEVFTSADCAPAGDAARLGPPPIMPNVIPGQPVASGADSPDPAERLRYLERELTRIETLNAMHQPSNWRPEAEAVHWRVRLAAVRSAIKHLKAQQAALEGDLKQRKAAARTNGSRSVDAAIAALERNQAELAAFEAEQAQIRAYVGELTRVASDRAKLVELRKSLEAAMKEYEKSPARQNAEHPRNDEGQTDDRRAADIARMPWNEWLMRTLSQAPDLRSGPTGIPGSSASQTSADGTDTASMSVVYAANGMDNVHMDFKAANGESTVVDSELQLITIAVDHEAHATWKSIPVRTERIVAPTSSFGLGCSGGQMAKYQVPKDAEIAVYYYELIVKFRRSGGIVSEFKLRSERRPIDLTTKVDDKPSAAGKPDGPMLLRRLPIIGRLFEKPTVVEGPMLLRSLPIIGHMFEYRKPANQEQSRP